MLRESMRTHTGTKLHKTSVEAERTQASQQIIPPPAEGTEYGSLAPAVLSFVHRFAQSDSESDAPQSPQQGLDDFYNSYIDHGDGVADRHGQPLIFSAGEEDHSQEESINRLRAQLAELESSHGHTVFAQATSTFLEERRDSVEEEPPSLIADAVAALEALGE